MRIITMLCVASMTAASACSDTFEKTYSSLAEAESDDAVTRGWIPDFVPRNAHNIRDIHNIDTNEQTLTFFIEPATVPEFLHDLAAPANEGMNDISFKVNEGRITVRHDTGHVTFKR
jgi:hypothetical protein